MKLPLTLRPASAAAIDAIAFGENSVDLVGVVETFPAPNSKAPLVEYRELPGGEAATAAVGLSRLGWRSAYVGRFGDDRLGEFARQHLQEEGVDITDTIVVPDTQTRLAIILVDQGNGNRTVLWQRAPGLHLRPDDLPDRLIETSRVLLVGSDDVPAMTSAAERAKRHGVCTVGDIEHIHPGTIDLLRQLDLIVMAASFPPSFTGEPDLGSALRRVAELSGAPFVCVTLGSDGCLAVVQGQEFHVPAFRVDVRDTTGAGDLFRAGLIAYLLAHPENGEVEEALRYANAVAALGCRGVGAQTSAPTPDEVHTLLGS